MRLVSFAVHWIRAEIHEYVLRNWRLVKIATTKAQRKLFFNLRRMKKNLAWLSADETRAVAKDLGVTTGRSHGDGAAPVGARHVLRPDPGVGRGRGLQPRRLPACAGFGPGRGGGSGRVGNATPSDRLQIALGRLDDRSRDILQKRWMTEDKATLHELADKYGVSAERIRQIESNALGKLRGLMAPAA